MVLRSRRRVLWKVPHRRRRRRSLCTTRAHSHTSSNLLLLLRVRPSVRLPLRILNAAAAAVPEKRQGVRGVGLDRFHACTVLGVGQMIRLADLMRDEERKHNPEMLGDSLLCAPSFNDIWPTGFTYRHDTKGRG